MAPAAAALEGVVDVVAQAVRGHEDPLAAAQTRRAPALRRRWFGFCFCFISAYPEKNKKTHNTSKFAENG